MPYAEHARDETCATSLSLTQRATAHTNVRRTVHSNLLVEVGVGRMPVAELARKAAPGAAVVELVGAGLGHLKVGDLQVIPR